jgi:nitronate monooxygenase
LFQGGMAVGVSGARLAGAVAAAGGMGTIATAGWAVGRPAQPAARNQQMVTLPDEIATARAQAPDGVVAINAMVALADYDYIVSQALEGGVQVIVSGAGLPLRLPELVQDHPDVAIVPIVSSLKALRAIARRWLRNFKRRPDAVIVEEPATAGGHLGARYEDVDDPDLRMDVVLPQVADYVIREMGTDVPVIAAGGIWDRSDIDRAFELGASGVQMATRFVCTHECDAPPAFKTAFLNATADDVDLVRSPTGLPGRALRNSFFDEVEAGEVDVPCLMDCLTRCGYRDGGQGFCIAKSLFDSRDGDADGGLVFCGSNVVRCSEIISVSELVGQLFPEILPAQPLSTVSRGPQEAE